LAFTLIPYTVNSFLSTFLLAQKQEKVILRVLGVSLFMLLMLNFVLIPMNGQVGASWATLAAAIAQSMLFVWAWMGNPLRRIDSPHLKGTSYELSDLS
jgi:O-antigen/teichoic acid export membrane protein